jgi:hypothetical protein
MPGNKKQADQNKKDAPALYNLAKKAPAPKCPGYGAHLGTCTFNKDGTRTTGLCSRCHGLASR